MNDLEKNRQTEKAAFAGFGLIFCGGLLLAILIGSFIAQTLCSLAIATVIWTSIFFCGIFRYVCVYTPGFEVRILQNTFLRKEMARDAIGALQKDTFGTGLRPCPSGFRCKLVSEVTLALIDIRAIPVKDEGESVNWATSDEQFAYVDDEFYLSVVPELAVRYYEKQAAGVTLEEMAEYFRGLTEVFKETYIIGKTLNQLRSRVADFDRAFKSFVATDPQLRQTMLEFGVRISGPSVFDVIPIKAIKDTMIAQQQAEREQNAVDIIKARNPQLSQWQANLINIANKGDGKGLNLDVREEQRREIIEVRGLPQGLVNYTHNTASSSGKPDSGGNKGGKAQNKPGNPNTP